MIHRLSLIFISALILSGCAANPVKIEFSPGHPANPLAQESSFAPPPNPFMDRGESHELPQGSENSMSGQQMHMEHHDGHDMGEESHKKSRQPATDNTGHEEHN